MAIGTALQGMRHNPRWLLAAARAIILTSALLAWWWHCRSLGTIRLDGGRRIATLLLQFRDPLECRCQLLLELGYQDAQFGVSARSWALSSSSVM